MAFRERRPHDPRCPIAVLEVRDLSFPAHWHGEVELLCLREGTLLVRLDGEAQRLHAGDALLAAPSSIHGYGGGGGRAVLMIFPPLAARPVLEIEGPGVPLRSGILRGIPEAGMLADLALASSAAPAPALGTGAGAEAWISSGAACALLGLFAARCSSDRPPAGTSPSASALKGALAFMEENYGRSLSLAETAAAAGLSPWYLSRLFPRLTGLGFHEWLVERRLAEAERLLRESDLTAAEVAEESGFGSLRGMDRAFAARRSATPREYRRREGRASGSRRGKGPYAS